MSTITLHSRLPDGLEPAAAALYWEAFGEKLGKLLGPDDKARRFFADTVNPDAVIAATDDAGNLLGIAAHKAGSQGFSTATTTDLFQHYGLGALWRLIPLAMLERDAPKDTLQMDGICVAGAARGQGVGSALFDAMFTFARHQGFKRVTLDVIDTNPRAKALYERLGFVATGREMTGPLRPLLGFNSATKMVLTLCTR
ncbi:Acetyltransferase (GNAT) family protein [Aliiroseovarius sediminilitoris]|uniref:Acetyltransferase (GNAT) family protein n=1 Tax=Aliiroseovarius sediminilitoris TaxID=1173584 RepID=A0A1I0QRS1_9RHOB|nr:GNAT family N-acetyltransferase [Aliiroseovarius sediminilitoris]SEW30283.1 Acetyltransferase (GNAT) family protein [Aliiroseovarius sediminilitoris]